MKTLRTIGTIARREIARIAADRWTVFVITLVPLLISIILASIYVNEVVLDIPTVVIDADGSAASRNIIRALDAHESLRVIHVGTGEEEAQTLLRSGEASCAVILPRNFERTLKRGESSPVLCFLNGSNMVLSNYALKAVSSTMTTATAGIAIDKLIKTGTPATHALVAYGPIAVNAQYIFNPGQNYANFFIPGILAALLQQVVVIGAALTWAREFRSGEIVQLLGISRNVFVLIAGKLLVYVLIGLVWAFFLFAGLFPLFGVPYTGSVLAGVVALVLMIAGMALLAMFISSLFSHRETAVQITFIVSSPAFLLSGYTFPQMAMTGVARWAGYIAPLTPFLSAWRKLVLYGGTMADVAGDMLLLIATIAVYGGLMYVVLHNRLSKVRESESLI
jgi:ABC-2 type transport system permease protein